jgi:hypothetical protein
VNPERPAGLVPFNVQNISGDIYVASITIAQAYRLTDAAAARSSPAWLGRPTPWFR